MDGEELRGHLIRCVASSVLDVRLGAVEASKYLGPDGEAALAEAAYPGMGKSYNPHTSFYAMKAAAQAGFLKPLQNYSEGRPGPITWEFMRALLDMGEPGWTAAAKHVYEGCYTLVELAIEAASRLGTAGVPALNNAVGGSGNYACRMLAVDAAEKQCALGLPVMESALSAYGNDLNIHAINALARLPDGIGTELLKKNYYVGNQGSPKAKAVLDAVSKTGVAGLPVLEHALLSSETNEYLGKQAAEAVARCGADGAALLSRLMDTAHPHVQKYLLHGAGFLGAAGVPILMKSMKDPNAGVPEEAVIAAGRIGDAAADIIIRASKESGSRAAYAAVEATAGLKVRAVEVYRAFFSGNSGFSSVMVSRLLQLGEDAVPTLKLALASNDINTRAEAARCAGELGEKGLELLEVAVKDNMSFCPQHQICDYYGPCYEYQLVKFAAIRAAAKLGENGRHLVEAGFKDEDIFVRLTAAPFMGKEGIELIRASLNPATGPTHTVIMHNWHYPTPTPVEVTPDLVPNAHREYAAGVLSPIAKENFDLVKLAYADPDHKVKAAAVLSAGHAGTAGLEILTDAFNTENWDMTNSSIAASAAMGKEAFLFLELVAEKGDYYQLESAIGVAKKMGSEALPLFEKIMAVQDGSRLRPEARADLARFVRKMGPVAIPVLKHAIMLDMLDYWASLSAKEAWEAAIEWGEDGLPLLLAVPKFEHGMLAEALDSGKFTPTMLAERLHQVFDSGDDKERTAILRAVTAWGGDAVPFLRKAFLRVASEVLEETARKIGKPALPALDEMLKKLEEPPEDQRDHCILAAVQEAFINIEGPDRFRPHGRKSLTAELAEMEAPEVERRRALMGRVPEGDPDWTPIIYRAAMDAELQVRKESLKAAVSLGKAGIPALLLLAMDKDERLRNDATVELKRALGGDLDGVLKEAWYMKGVALADAGRHGAALDALRNIEGDEGLDDPMFNYNKARALLGEGRHEEALAIFDKELAQDAENGFAWYNKGVVLLQMGRNEEALAASEKAVQYRPNDGQAWGNRGSALSNLGRYDEAVKAFDRAIELNSEDVNALYNKGSALLRLGRFEEAISPLDKAVKLDPSRTAAWNELGIANQNHGQHDAAFAAYDRALLLDPNNANALVNKGGLLVALRRYDEAIACFDKVMGFEPNNILAIFNKAHTLEMMGQKEHALATFDKVLELDPSDVSAKYCRARLLAMLDRPDEALGILEKLVAMKAEFKEEVKKDEAFEKVRNLERFNKLMG